MKEASLSSNQEPSYRSISMESDSQPVHAKGLSPPVRQYESGQPPMSRRLRKKMQQKRREEDQSQKWNQSQEVRSVLLEEESPNNELSTDVDGKTNHETATQGAHFSSSAAVKASAQRLAQVSGRKTVDFIHWAVMKSFDFASRDECLEHWKSNPCLPKCNTVSIF